MQNFLRAIFVIGATSPCVAALADNTIRADSHAPIGVMAEHTHAQGEWMVSYRFMTMDMDGSRLGSKRIAPEAIATTQPNRFAGQPMQPPTLRVVPLDMRMDMHMFGFMYAPTDRITLMAMINYLDKQMDHRSYQGAVGTTVLGNFTTRSSGLGDTSVAALLGIVDRDDRKLHLIAGLSLPTGSTDETDAILTPMNMRPTVRLPYPMQLGSGSIDPLVGASFAAYRPSWSWGAQWRSTLRLFDNDDDYQLGDEHRLTAWASYLWRPAVSSALRLEYARRGNISGSDSQIVGPVQTADPDRQQFSRVDVGVSLNIAGNGRWQGYRFALEFLAPLEQDFDGPQLETDHQLVLGVQKSF